VNGHTRKLREGFVRGMLSTVRPQYFVCYIDEFSFGRLGRRLKDNIKKKIGGIISEYVNGHTRKLREDFVRGMLSTVRPQHFVSHFAVYECRDNITYLYIDIILHGIIYGRETGLLHKKMNVG